MITSVARIPFVEKMGVGKKTEERPIDTALLIKVQKNKWQIAVKRKL